MNITEQLLTSCPQYKKAIELIQKTNQEHLLENWDLSEGLTVSKENFFKQVLALNEQYPGGLRTYCANAKHLLAASKRGDNPYEGYTPKVPEGVNLTPGNAEFLNLEKIGFDELAHTGFVLVAGGLGERLGYSGIKIALPSETVTGKSFLQMYIENILAYQTKSSLKCGKKIELPLAIMTSGDTHQMTVEFLNTHHNFGMKESQLTIMKQEKVPSLIDNQAHFILSEDDPFEIETKPHGHGDVHVLMHLTGTGKKWLDQGIKHVVFFQDTNGVVFNAIPAALGVSTTREFEVNSLTVPRRAGEAAGGIVKLEKSNGETLTINVEYNQLDPLLKSTINPKGDVADASGYSPYPGNINILIFALQPYMANLERSGGQIPEFVNPKYADELKEKFKKPARLECMMQEFPKLLPAGAKIGFTSFPREYCFSAVKNNLNDAAAKSAAQMPAESASSGEMDFYSVNRQKLRMVGAEISDAPVRTISGIQLTPGPKVVLSGSFASTISELQHKIKSLSLSARSTLVIEGENISIDHLELDGKLVIRVKDGASLNIKNLKIQNEGDTLVETTGSESEEILIRGYQIITKEERLIEINEGQHTISQ